MESVATFNYKLDYDKSKTENQIILWKIDNYKSYLTNFNISLNDYGEELVKCETELDHKDCIFTYNTVTKKTKVENLFDEDLIQKIILIEEPSVYDFLTSLEKLIDELPEDTEDELPEVLPKAYARNLDFEKLKLDDEINKILMDINYHDFNLNKFEELDEISSETSFKLEDLDSDTK